MNKRRITELVFERRSRVRHRRSFYDYGLRGVNPLDVFEFETVDVLYDGILFWILEPTVPKTDVADRVVFVPTEIERVLAVLDGKVLNGDILYSGVVIAAISLPVEEVDLERSTINLPNLRVLEVDVLYVSSSDGIRLDAETPFEVRATHPVIDRKHVLHATGHLAADDHSTVAIFHMALTNDNVTSRNANPAPIGVPPCLQRDAIVASIERTTLDHDVLAGLGIAAVVVRSVAVHGYVLNRHVLAQFRVDLPHWRVLDRHTADHHVPTAEGLDERGTQVVARTEDPLSNRDAIRSHLLETLPIGVLIWLSR